MYERNHRRRIFLACLLWAALSAPTAWAQTSPGIEQLKKQIEELKSQAASYDSWSPALRGAYDKSLHALITAYEKAAAQEIRQLNDLLKVVTEPNARQPLEEQLRQFTSFSQVTGAAVPRVEANAAPRAALTALPTPTPAVIATPSPTPKPFTLTVYVRVKGTGYPVSYAHVQLLELSLDSTQADYRPVEKGFTCNGQAARKCNSGFQRPLELSIYDVAGPIKLAVQKDLYYPYVMTDVIQVAADERQIVNIELTPRDDENFRAILGVEQTGASSTNSRQNIFFNLFTSRPLLGVPFFTEPGPTNCQQGKIRQNATEENDATSNDDIKEYKCTPPRHRIWGDFRLTSLPQTEQNLFKALNGALGSGLNTALDNLSDLQTGFAFLGGYQFKLKSGSLAGNRFDFSLIAGGGATGVPFPNDRNTTIYKFPDEKDVVRLKEFKKRVHAELSISDEDLAKYTNAAFVVKERDRFYRNYFGGLRFETHYGDTTPQRPSGMVDVTIGQDELVTGGRLRGSVLRLDGFFPLPLGKGNLVYLFGNAQLGLKRTKIADPLLLPLADTTQTLTSPTTLVVPVQAANRDLYRFGIGVNLFQVFSGNRNQ